MKNKLFTFLALLTVAFGAVTMRAQQPQPLPAGYKALDLSREDQKRLSEFQKDATIINLEMKLNAANLKEAQAEEVSLQASYQAWLERFRRIVDEVRKKNKFGDDVNYDFERGQFVRGPKVVPKPPPAK